MCKFRGLGPRRAFNLALFDTKRENSLEPEGESIGLAMSKQLKLENPVNFDNFFIGHFFEVKSEHFSNIANNETLINNSNNRLM